MKNLLLIAIIVLGFSGAAFAQPSVGVTATATSSATIITPIAIAKSTAGDMNFGNVAVSGTGGTVILSPTNARSFTGGVALPTILGTVASASFDVTGLGGSVYSITIPTTSISAISGASPAMSVGTWTSFPTVATGGILDGSGKQTVKVGATLTVAALQPAGTYITPAFSVTVNYN